MLAESTAHRVKTPLAAVSTTTLRSDVPATKSLMTRTGNLVCTTDQYRYARPYCSCGGGRRTVERPRRAIAGAFGAGRPVLRIALRIPMAAFPVRDGTERRELRSWRSC